MDGRPTKRRRGFTLVETMFAVLLTSTILIFTLSLFFTSMLIWTKGSGNILSESASHMAIRVMANQLRQSYNVTVDSNGLGVTYLLPKQVSGTDVVPLLADGNTYRFQLDNGSTLNMYTNGVLTRTVATGIVLTDPLNSNASYVIFTPNAGSITRVVTVEVATQANTYDTQTESSRNRETIYLRNVPQVITQ